MKFQEIKAGQRFIVDNGLGPEEHTATADARRSTSHTVTELWFVRTLNRDKCLSHVKTDPETPVTLLP